MACDQNPDLDTEVFNDTFIYSLSFLWNKNLLGFMEKKYQYMCILSSNSTLQLFPENGLQDPLQLIAV